MTEIILGIIGAISTIIASWLAYRQFKTGQETEKLKVDRDQEKEFIDDVMGRVETLETRVDNLTDKVISTAEKAEEERRKLVSDYETRIEQVRKEMRRLIDDAHMELSMWRDKYFKLIEDYQRLKFTNNELEVKFDRLDKEYKELRTMYRRRVGDSLDIDDRKSPDIGDTA